jgi:hypothetical protein
VNTFRTPEVGAHSPSWPNGLVIIIIVIIFIIIIYSSSWPNGLIIIIIIYSSSWPNGLIIIIIVVIVIIVPGKAVGSVDVRQAPLHAAQHEVVVDEGEAGVVIDEDVLRVAVRAAEQKVKHRRLQDLREHEHTTTKIASICMRTSSLATNQSTNQTTK